MLEACNKGEAHTYSNQGLFTMPIQLLFPNASIFSLYCALALFIGTAADISALPLSLPNSQGMIHGTPALAAASINFVCVSGGAVKASMMMNISWPLSAETRKSSDS